MEMAPSRNYKSNEKTFGGAVFISEAKLPNPLAHREGEAASQPVKLNGARHLLQSQRTAETDQKSRKIRYCTYLKKRGTE